jgi:Secretion system C-terminal sorting domain
LLILSKITDMKTASIKIGLLVIFSLHICKSYAQTISTIAGGVTGHGGYWGDGGQATAAELWGPVGLAIDSKGNLYIGDGQINRVRKVNLVSGIITTYAGTGVSGFFGDGGPATAAKIAGASFIAVDTADNLFIGDAFNNRIRVVTASTGIITTFAGDGSIGSTGDGGPATAASFYLGGVACDTFGNVYLGDYDKVRKVNASGIVSTVAGDGLPGVTIDGSLATTTHLGSPQSVCTDILGNVFMADSTDAIRKLTVSTGILSRVAGVGDGGLTYDGDGIPATTCHLNAFGVKIDNEGNLYNAGYGNNRVVMVDATGIIHTVAGTGTGGFSGDGGLATAAKLNLPKDVTFDACGNIYIADFSNKRVRKITRPVPILTTPAISLSGVITAPAGSTVTVNATVAKAGSSYIIHWLNKGVEFTTTTVPSVTYTKGAGTDTITARVVSTATYGCYDSTTSGQHIIKIPPVGVQQLAATTVLSVYPNPAHDVIRVGGIQDSGTYKLLDMVGRVLQAGTVDNVNNVVDIKNVAKGVYILEMSNSEEQKTITKIIKQ